MWGYETKQSFLTLWITNYSYKKLFKWREECNTYLTHICRHRYVYSWWKSQFWLKAPYISSFHQVLSAPAMLKRREEYDSYLTHICRHHYIYSWWKPQCWLRAPYISSFHQVLSATMMSTDVSQVGVVLFPSFVTFLLFHLFRLFVYINN